MNVSVKSLQKQLVAAVAMVCVAAIALGSSTYAWFVSNNTVTATTSSIAAQSNSAYLVIDTQATSTSSTNNTMASGSIVSIGDDMKLYPAQWANNYDASKTTTGSKVYQFETAYASTKDAATEKDGTRFAVGDPTKAVSEDYAVLNTFYIGTGTYDGVFTNLKVDGLTVTGTDGIVPAIRVLVQATENSTTNWVVAKPVMGQDAYTKVADGDEYYLTGAGANSVKINGATYAGLAATTSWAIESQSGRDGVIFASAFGKDQTPVDVVVNAYVYYDGSDAEIYTTNLDQIDAGANVTVSFSATPVTHGA